MDDADLPTDKGTYVLLLRLDAPIRLAIGRFGTFDFAEGWYAYVGSAFGSGGLRGRLKHHLTPVRKAHWHIDCLREVAPLCEVWWQIGETKNEHRWANELREMPGAMMLAAGFGASDCRCRTHLVAFSEKPDFDEFSDRLNGSLREARTLLRSC